MPQLSGNSQIDAAVFIEAEARLDDGGGAQVQRLRESGARGANEEKAGKKRSGTRPAA